MNSCSICTQGLITHSMLCAFGFEIFIIHMLLLLLLLLPLTVDYANTQFECVAREPRQLFEWKGWAATRSCNINVFVGFSKNWQKLLNMSITYYEYLHWNLSTNFDLFDGRLKFENMLDGCINYNINGIRSCPIWKADVFEIDTCIYYMIENGHKQIET